MKLTYRKVLKDIKLGWNVWNDATPGLHESEYTLISDS